MTPDFGTCGEQVCVCPFRWCPRCEVLGACHRPAPQGPSLKSGCPSLTDRQLVVRDLVAADNQVAADNASAGGAFGDRLQQLC